MLMYWLRGVAGGGLPVLKQELSALMQGSFPASDEPPRQEEMQGGFDGNLFVCSPGSPVILHSSALACLFPSLLLLLALMIRPVN